MRRVANEQLEYLRTHIREAIAEDRIVCLECGAAFRNLVRHLVFTHRLPVEEYRAKWGYNRLTGLVCGELLAWMREHAKQIGLGSRNTREMALEALRARQAKGPIPLRQEGRERFREVQQSPRLRAPRCKITDEELIALAGQGLSFVQIARQKGMGKVTVWKRLARLKARGVPIPIRCRRKTRDTSA
jgi:hypothetical protein